MSRLPGGSGATTNAAEALALAERHIRMARGAAPGGGVTPAFRGVPEQITNHGGDGIVQPVLDGPFQAARKEARRAGMPEPSIEQFLARVDPDSSLGRLVDELLGTAQAMLLRTANPADFERAIRDHYRAFRTTPPPYDAGLSYARHHYLDGAHIDLRRRLRVVPPNAPHWSRDGIALYPDWKLGRERANRSVAAVQLSRILGREIPLDRGGRDLFEALSLQHGGADAFDCYLDPELRLSAVQWAYTLSSGNSPIYRSVLSTSKPKGKGLKLVAERNAEQARWELAARLGRPDLIDNGTDLRRAWDEARSPQSGTRPTAVVEHDAFSQASTDELFSMALREPGAPKVYMATTEWEHHRSQRLTTRIDGLAVALKVGDAWRSRFRMLTGICEPENLHFLMPWQHAMEDFYAGGFSPVRGGGFNATAFQVNSARRDRWDNTLVTEDLAAHPDLARAKDALVSYQPRDLIPLLSAMHDDEVLRAAADLSGSPRAAWNALADQLNRAATVFAIEPALRLPMLK